MDVKDFMDIAPEHKALVESYTQPWALNSSEYTFTNLLMWGTNGRIRLCERQDALFMLLHYSGDPFMFAPLPKDPNADYGALLETGTACMKQLGIPVLYKAVCGPLVEAFSRCPDYELIPDRDNYDYIYSMEELLRLSGKKLHAKRNHINQFKAQYEYEYVKVTPDMLPECMEVYRRWLEGKDVFEPGILGEMEAIKQIMTHMELLGVKGGGIRVSGELAAFTLGQRINSEMAVIHIEKADEMTGLYAMINQQFIEHEFTDMKYINREEDMGLEGLRRAKLSYNPVMLLEKFEGRLKA